MQKILDEIGNFTTMEANRDLPPEVMHHAKRAVLDWFAALYPGTRVAPTTQLVRAHFRELGIGRSSLPGFKTTAFPALAAWINGTAAHAVEFDDIFRDAIYHPGAPTIAAALAVAQDEGCSGRDFLRAVTVGYEISTRIGAAVQPSHYKYFHTTGTVGCFGSASAAAFLLAPQDARVMRHAIATVASFAAGLQQAFRSESMTKALHSGHAAASGVVAAMGAASGITGAIDILEGEVGFGAAMAQNPVWRRASEAFGSRYNITQVTQKSHGCCGHTFAAIDAVLALRAQHGTLDPSMINAIIVDTYQTAIDVTGNFAPRSAQEARFSLPYVICHALLHGSVRLNAFTDKYLNDSQTRSLMARVRLNSDPDLSAGFPLMRAARVTVCTEDGQRLQHFSPSRKGDPEAPLSDADLNDKFDELVMPVIGHKPAQRLRNQLWQLDRIDLTELQLVPG